MFKERTWTKLLNPLGDVWVHHQGILCKCIYGRWPDKLLGQGKGIHCLWRVSRRAFREPSNDSGYLFTLWWEKRKSWAVQVLEGQLKKKALHMIDFTLEMRVLAYIMIFNLYPMKNLTTFPGPRTIFLHDLFTHKEIDICGHIYHLFVKCVQKFPSLIMSLISKA